MPQEPVGIGGEDKIAEVEHRGPTTTSLWHFPLRLISKFAFNGFLSLNSLASDRWCRAEELQFKPTEKCDVAEIKSEAMTVQIPHNLLVTLKRSTTRFQGGSRVKDIAAVRITIFRV